MKKEKTLAKHMNGNPIEMREMEYESLLQNVGNALSRGRQRVASYIGTQTVRTYWEIGKYIVEYEQNGHEKAEYGSDLLNRLSKDMRERYGKGFGRSSIYNMRKLFLTYPKIQTLSGFLTWSHYVELLKIEDPLERSFYEKPEDILKEPFVFEFTGLPQLPTYSEGDLEESLINNLSMFFLELGKGFTYVGNQYRINIAGRTYKIDLVLYNRILKCFVLIDLKKGEVQHEDIGQMNFYLNYCREEMNTEGDTEPIGIVLGTDRDKLVMKYALQDGGLSVFFAALFRSVGIFRS